MLNMRSPTQGSGASRLTRGARSVTILNMCVRDRADTTSCDSTAQTSLRSKESSRRYAGFWFRFGATLIDGVVIVTGVWGASRLCVRAGLYVPLELSVLIVGAIYSALFLGWRGRTLGKALCGVTVRSRADEPIGFRRAMVRETLGKFVSTAPLLLGFVWVALSRKKLAWHDHLTGTIVIQDPYAARRGRIVLATVLVAVALGAGAYVQELAHAYRLVRLMTPPADATAPFAKRDPSLLVEVAELDDQAPGRIAEWIDANSKAPVEYAVAKAAEHPVVIFGEVHWRRDALRFLNEMIPVLYHRTGLRCVAMEACLAEDNAAIERLVTASNFDRDLAMAIARHHPWSHWGWKGYWDVFETVWRLNRTIPEGGERVKIIGLERRIDLPSAAMVGLEDNAARDCAVWEKLRIFRVIRSIPRMFARDAFMARQIEMEMIEKGQRGIVWVGRNHSSIGCPQSGLAGNSPRMGFMLHQRHGDKIFQIRLHGMDLSAAFIDETYDGPGPMMAKFLETVMQRRYNLPVGFDVAPSPLAMLRDDDSFDFHFEPRLGFVDVAAGYVFLAPWRDLKTCEWLEGYISPRMFVTNKPFYRAFGHRAGVEINDAKDANDKIKRHVTR